MQTRNKIYLEMRKNKSESDKEKERGGGGGCEVGRKRVSEKAAQTGENYIEIMPPATCSGSINKKRRNCKKGTNKRKIK